MRQVKLILVALTLGGILSFSHADKLPKISKGSAFLENILNSNHADEFIKLAEGSSFTGVEPTSVQENLVSNDEKEDNGVDNALKEYGPLTICADKATYNSEKGTLVYYGNVFVMQIHNKHILCRKVKNPKQGNVYFTRNKKDSFSEIQEKWLNQAKEICEDEKECNFISGQKLIMQLDKNNKVQTLVMDTKGEYMSQFYTYPTKANNDFRTSKELTKGPLDGESKTITYSVVNKSLELHKKATINQNENQYKGDRIIYDLERDLVTIPGSKNRRSKIVLDGIQDQTKLDTGLTTIADLHKGASANSGSSVSMTNTDSENSDNPEN